MISTAQLTFGDQTSAAPAETASGGTPIAIVSIANGVVGSASSKDASKTSSVAATEEEEDPGADEVDGGGNESKSEVLKNVANKCCRWEIRAL